MVSCKYSHIDVPLGLFHRSNVFMCFVLSIHALLPFVEPYSLVICLSLYCYSVVVNYLSLYCLTILLCIIHDYK